MHVDKEDSSRSADETLELLFIALEKRRNYLKNKMNLLPASKRRGSRLDKGLSLGGKLDEMTTIICLIQEIQSGSIHPDEIWDI
ncbi:MAG: hypothetical protein K0Q73_5813 [Paenibacillus sp.]|jgi:hypothetical protein|nr:hypothetical protein [Paenibacillus sp.]